MRLHVLMNRNGQSTHAIRRTLAKDPTCTPLVCNRGAAMEPETAPLACRSSEQPLMLTERMLLSIVSLLLAFVAVVVNASGIVA